MRPTTLHAEEARRGKSGVTAPDTAVVQYTQTQYSNKYTVCMQYSSKQDTVDTVDTVVAFFERGEKNERIRNKNIIPSIISKLI